MELKVDGRKVYAATGGRPFDPAKPAVRLRPRRRAGPHQLAAAGALVRLARPFRAGPSTCRGTGAPTGRRSGACRSWRSGSAALMDAADVERAALVGHSMGGGIAAGGRCGAAGAHHAPRPPRHGAGDPRQRGAARRGTRGAGAGVPDDDRVVARACRQDGRPSGAGAVDDGRQHGAVRAQRAGDAAC